MKQEKDFFETNDDEILSAEILEFAREYQSTDFPNPQRKNCPSNNELLELATSVNLPEPELRQHLLSCSPCFNEFHKAKNSAVSVVSFSTDTKEKWFSFFLKPLPAALCLLILAGIAGLAIFLWFETKQSEIAQQNSGFKKAVNDADNQNPVPFNEKNETVNSPKNNPAENAAINKDLENSKLNPNSDGANKQNINRQTENRLVSKNRSIYLDLAKNTVLRNENTTENIYSIPAENVSLNIRLINGSPAGNYEISLLDEFGKPLSNAKLQNSNGKNLKLDFDFRNKKGRARLCVAPKGEIPDCFPIKISPAKP